MTKGGRIAGGILSLVCAGGVAYFNLMSIIRVVTLIDFLIFDLISVMDFLFGCMPLMFSFVSLSVCLYLFFVKGHCLTKFKICLCH